MSSFRESSLRKGNYWGPFVNYLDANLTNVIVCLFKAGDITIEATKKIISWVFYQNEEAFPYIFKQLYHQIVITNLDAVPILLDFFELSSDDNMISGTFNNFRSFSFLIVKNISVQKNVCHEFFI